MAICRILTLIFKFDSDKTERLEFSGVELKVIMNFLFLQKKTPEKIHECMMGTVTNTRVILSQDITLSCKPSTSFNS